VNVNPLLMEAGTALSLPIYPNVYKSAAGTAQPDDYLTFNYSDERPIMRADDGDQYDQTTIQLHEFCKGDPQEKKKALRNFLRSKGFTIVSTGEFYESDTKYNHIVVEASITAAMDDEEE
jgi:hypothetical protein